MSYTTARALHMSRYVHPAGSEHGDCWLCDDCTDRHDPHAATLNDEAAEAVEGWNVIDSGSDPYGDRTCDNCERANEGDAAIWDD